jgi:acyl carrier protein
MTDMTKSLSMFQRVEGIILQECHVSKVRLILPETSITNDLGIDTDDISFYLIPALHGEFGKELSLAQWAEIETVDDVISAFNGGE